MTQTANDWGIIEKSIDSWEAFEAIGRLKENNPYREAIEKIGANIEGKLTALEMQTIALEAINAART